MSEQLARVRIWRPLRVVGATVVLSTVLSIAGVLAADVAAVSASPLASKWSCKGTIYYQDGMHGSISSNRITTDFPVTERVVVAYFIKAVKKEVDGVKRVTATCKGRPR